MLKCGTELFIGLRNGRQNNERTYSSNSLINEMDIDKSNIYIGGKCSNLSIL